jgi:ParG
VHDVPLSGTIAIGIFFDGGYHMERKGPGRKRGMPPVDVEPKSVRLELAADIHKQFRVEAAKEGMSMAAVAKQLVEEWLSKRAKK